MIHKPLPIHDRPLRNRWAEATVRFLRRYPPGRRPIRQPEVSVTVRLVPALLVLTLGGLLAGCGASGESSSGSEAAAGAAADSGSDSGSDTAAKAQPFSGSARREAQSGSAQSAGDPSGSSLTAAATAVTSRVRTADLTVEVPSLPPALARVRAATAALGGVVSNEDSRFPNSGKKTAQSVLTLRVPEPRLDDALTRLGAIGRELNRSTTSEDVTATLADLDSREATAERSVARVRDLMDRATSLKDVVLLESELSKRQSDLEAVQARQRVLSDQATLSTITLELRTPAAAPKPAKSHHGFIAGLRGGWDAVGASTLVVVTVLGALLPIAAVLLLLGVPAYLLYRRYARRIHGVSHPAGVPPTS
jgi:hypothetical protein